MNKLILITSIIIIGLLGYLLYSNSNLHSKIDKSDQNIKALSDTVHISLEKNHIVYSKMDFVVDKIDDLKNYDPALYDSLKNSVKDIKKVSTIINNHYYYSDSIKKNIPTHVSHIDSNRYELGWSYVSKDSTRILSGKTKIDLSFIKQKMVDSSGKFFYVELFKEIIPKGTDILEDKMKFGVTVGIRKKGKYEEIFVIPDNPNLKVVSINGAVIHRKIPKFSIGPNVSVGVGYIPTLGVFYPYIGVGIGLTYGLLRF